MKANRKPKKEVQLEAAFLRAEESLRLYQDALSRGVSRKVKGCLEAMYSLDSARASLQKARVKS